MPSPGTAITISSGVTSSGGIVSSGTTWNVSGSVVSTTVAGGTVNVASGGSATAIEVTSGYLNVSAGGTLSGVTGSATGAMPANISLNGAIANGVVLGSGGVLTLVSANLSSLQMASGAQANINSGAVLLGAQIATGGAININAGSLVSGAVLSGALYNNGGVDSATTIASGASETISSGGAAFNIVLQSGGQLTILSGGYVSGLTNSNGMVSNFGGTLLGSTGAGGTYRDFHHYLLWRSDVHPERWQRVRHPGAEQRFVDRVIGGV